MKAVFLKSAGRFGEKLSLLFSLFLFPLAVMGTDSTYISPPSVTSPPMVDATNFINSGIWNIFTLSPYETAHTLNYTNKSPGSMTGQVGWEFDWGAAILGPRSWSANFFNDNNCKITAEDYDFQNPVSSRIYTPKSYVIVSATNIVNKGTLAAGNSGEIILSGVNVNLTHSQLEIIPLVPAGSDNGTTNFTPDRAIYDEYWGATNSLTVTGSPWDGARVDRFTGQNMAHPCGLFSTIHIGPFYPTVADSISAFMGWLIVTATNFDTSHTDYYLPTNQFRQGVFVLLGTPAITGQVKFLNTGSTSNLFDNVVVQLSSVTTNVVNGQLQTNNIYLADILGSSLQLGLLTNSTLNPASACSGPTLRPTNYIVSRLNPSVPGTPEDGFGPPADVYYYDPLTFSNYVVSGGSWSAYSAFIDNLAVEVRDGMSVTNYPGRVRVYADNLNLNQTKVRAEGQIIIQATNLIGSANAAMDCQNLSFNLGSTNTLNFTNLALPLVGRLHGTIDMWSGVWTNYEIITIPNWASNSVGEWAEADLINVLQINLYIFVVDASGLSNIAPVTVQDLILHSTNIVIGDSVNVDQSFLLDGQSATLQGNVSLSGAVQNWNYANAPTLRYFTNNGVLSIPNAAHFGDDGPTNYLAFVNNGSIFSGGQMIDTVNLQINNGLNESFSEGFYAVAQTAQLTHATINSVSDIQFWANTLQIGNSTTLSAGGALDFTVTNSLSDGGAGSGNLLVCQNGFNLWIKPQAGGLLNTTIRDIALGQTWVNHVWAGQDVGRSTSGFVNNAAIKTLILAPLGTQWPGYLPMFEFSPATGGNALYVSNLDLSLLADYANEILIDPGMRIYFATASLNPSVVIAPSPDAEHFLDGKFGDQLRWVGVTSFVKTNGNAYTQKFQLAANYNAAVRQFELTENITPGQTNVTEASTDLFNWVPICTNIGSYSNFGPFTILDSNSQSNRSRFYRFKILP
jgi:hypothetical protein